MTRLFTEKEQSRSVQNELVVGIYELELNDALRLADVNKTSKGVLKIVYPKDDELFIDLDSESAYGNFQERFQYVKVVSDEWGSASYKTTPSKSGLPKRHVVIRVPGKVFSDYERLALQFAFGSDFIREALSAFRGACGNKNLSVFFEVDKTSWKGFWNKVDWAKL